MLIATVAWMLLTTGLVVRKNKSQHVALMLLGILLDIGLVVYLQLTREAVQTAVEFSLPLLEQIHIACSTVALLLYFPILYLGVKLQQQVGAKEPILLNRLGFASYAWRTTHIRLGLAAYIFRTLGFLFMFSMIK